MPSWEKAASTNLRWNVGSFPPRMLSMMLGSRRRRRDRGIGRSRMA